MKQHETTTKEIGGNTFYIRPFEAWTSIAVHGDLIVSLAPVLTPIAGSTGASDVMNLDVLSFATALSSLSGDKLVQLLKKMLTKHNNISVETDDGVKMLSDELTGEIFCGDAQDMFVLAWEVIRVNFPAIFKKLGGLFGDQKLSTLITALTNTEN
jgi:hypothetical protein